MIDLTFNTYGYAFEHGLLVIEQSFSVAAQALRLSRDSLIDELGRYRETVESGQPQIGEWDEDGTRLWDREQLLEFEIDDAEAALATLRKAFVVALYHHWERAMLRQLKRVNEKHADLVKLGRSRGMTFHPRIDAVRDMANLFKHANSKWAKALLKSWPTLLPNGFTSNPFNDGYSAAVLTDEIVHEVVEILRESGPRTTEYYPEQ